MAFTSSANNFPIAGKSDFLAFLMRISFISLCHLGFDI
jgi:hypothetical protein